MKKTLITTLLFAVSFFAATNAKAVSVQAEWGGSPLILCQGEGICTICFPPASESNADMNYDANNALILFSVPASTIPADKADMFKGSTFTLDYDFTMSDDLCKALGVESGTVLPKGSYNLSYLNGVYYFAIKIATIA